MPTSLVEFILIDADSINPDKTSSTSSNLRIAISRFRLTKMVVPSRLIDFVVDDVPQVYDRALYTGESGTLAAIDAQLNNSDSSV